MAQMRSFSSFGATPNAASAYAGGAGIVQRDQELAAKVQSDRAQLANQYAIAEMESSSRKAALAQSALKDAQELEVQKYYQQSMLGLKDRELQMQNAVQMQEAEAMARKFSAQESMRRSVEEAIAKGSTPGAAFSEGVARFGAQADLPGTAFSDMIQAPGAGGDDGLGPAQMMPVEGTDQYDYFKTGKGSRQLVPRKSAEIPEAVDIEDSGYQRIGDRVLRKVQPAELTDLRKKRDTLEKFLTSADASPGRMALARSKEKGVKLTKPQEFLMNEYLDKQKQLQEIEGKISGFSESKPSGKPTLKIRSIRQKGE